MEKDSQGRLLCPRGGAAVDFFSERFSADTIGAWLVKNLNFDRLYFYGGEKPIHVSYNINNLGKVVLLKKINGSNRMIPRQLTHEQFLALEKYGP